jgi:hypothetical protein
MSEAETTNPAEILRHQRSMERQLALAILGASLYFVLVAAGAIVTALLLLEPTRSSDLSGVAALSLAGGALGASVRSLYEVMMKLEAGSWELADGTIVERSLRRRLRARECYLLEHASGSPGRAEADELGEPLEPEPEPRAGSRSEEDAIRRLIREEDRRALGLTRAEYAVLEAREQTASRTDAFGLLDLPLLILLPLLGAALGLVAFAGLVGGFLIASGSDNPSYSPAGLIFVAALAGMFAPNFIASLARAADAIFGKTQQPPGTAAERPKEGRY